MIIGNGLIADAFKKYRHRRNVVIFASGVSNSLEQKKNVFLREQELLKESLKKNTSSLFVYFGTCSVYDPATKASPYVNHKMSMEELVRKEAAAHLIIRLPQVVGPSDNCSTLSNFLYNNIVNDKSFDLWSGAVRYLVDIDDVVQFISFVIDGSGRTNIIVNMVTVPCKIIDIVIFLEKIIGKKAVYSIIDKGIDYVIPILEPDLTMLNAGIVIDGRYTEKVLFKYYNEMKKLVF